MKQEAVLIWMTLMNAAGLSAVFALLSCVMITASRAQPIGAFINGLSLCDGKVCYLNIVPGKTGLEAAQTILESFPTVTKFGASGYANLPHFYGTLLLIPNQDSLTQEVALSLSDNATFVGSAILQLGAPCPAVRMGWDDLALIYPSISIITQMKKVGNYFVVRPTSPITRAVLSGQVESCSDIGLDRTRADFRWHGFVRYAEGGD